ncbi:Hypothetical_protein [Hexamita inflata]|uniref:Hypothetical_protein n=1 Tax=Hexamita inflata TaxID=28002 RepID=A0AA86TD26_9EUKA|nr:Hypothetical protein HINF_LOCUS677 [Hexamita inflata]
MLLFHSEVSLGVPGYAYIKELLLAIFYERYISFSVVVILTNVFDISNFDGVNHFVGQLSNKVITIQYLQYSQDSQIDQVFSHISINKFRSNHSTLSLVDKRRKLNQQMNQIVLCCQNCRELNQTTCRMN